MRLETFEEFAVAVKEFVDLEAGLSKISGVLAQLRAQQRRTSDAITESMLVRAKIVHVCGDMTVLRVSTTPRRVPLNESHVMAEALDSGIVPSRSAAHQFWERVQERRGVTETERLAIVRD